jgi:hypothetical protein
MKELWSKNSASKLVTYARAMSKMTDIPIGMMKSD